MCNGQLEVVAGPCHYTPVMGLGKWLQLVCWLTWWGCSQNLGDPSACDRATWHHDQGGSFQVHLPWLSCLQWLCVQRLAVAGLHVVVNATVAVVCWAGSTPKRHCSGAYCPLKAQMPAAYCPLVCEQDMARPQLSPLICLLVGHHRQEVSSICR